MTNRKFAISVASVAFILLILCVVLLLSDRNAAHNEVHPVWQLSVSGISYITIDNHGDFLRFDNDGRAGWTLAAPDDIAYDRSLVQALPLALANLTAEDEFEAGNELKGGNELSGGDAFPVGGNSSGSEDRSSEFGFDDPIEIRVYPETGVMRKLLLGGVSQSGDTRFFSIGDGKIYTMDTTKSNALALNSLNIRDKNVLRLNRTLRPDDIAARITNITLNGVSSPELAGAIARLTAEEFISITGYEEFGLAPPRYAIGFMTENGVRTLYIGDTTRDGEHFYAATDDQDLIFTVLRRGFESLEFYTSIPG